ncbi:MAG: glycoside hydrolase family 2 protein [Anaerolineales bacterium]
MRTQILFDDSWLFAGEKLDLEAPDERFEAVTLPHSNRLFSHHNIDNSDYQFTSTYRKRFVLPQDVAESQVILEFQGVMLAATLYLNGDLIGEHLGGFTPFELNITDYLQKEENLLTVYVDSRERKDIPPFGHLVDYLTFGGIYRDVYLKILAEEHIEEVCVRTEKVLEEPLLQCEIRVNRPASGLELEAILLDNRGKALAETQGPVAGTVSQLVFRNLPGIQLWDVEDPVLYTLAVSLRKEGQIRDGLETRFGFREAEFREDGGFYLNGRRLPLLGLNRHQTYPYIGAAAPARLQRRDADILKSELACNIVRTSHYPQSPHFLDRCDEIGLLVFEEIAGWQHIGDEDWQELVLEDLQSMIKRDRNHPSIILWGVRINESPDNDTLYRKTNQLAHDLDPTRQTGGVRCFLESSFLEDVFTYNDFSNTVVDPVRIPYLITEFAGHMFPTKIWDHEERLIDQALLHARIQDLQLGNAEISGAIGWCAFDYATHIEFGSGDRICYHGVMDTFRLPKWAAYFYKSQLSPEKEIVLKAATHWTMGDRSGGGNNPLTVFSNCEEVEVVIGDIQVGRFTPARESYPNLAHPPIIITGLDKYSAWGQRQFHDLQLIGYIQGEAVAEQLISSSRLPRRLELEVDDLQLVADGSDMTRLAFRITDEFGNPTPYVEEAVQFELEGEADLIGNNPFLLMGGQAAVYLKARKQPGRVTIRARAGDLPGRSISIELVSPESKDGS